MKIKILFILIFSYFFIFFTDKNTFAKNKEQEKKKILTLEMVFSQTEKSFPGLDLVRIDEKIASNRLLGLQGLFDTTITSKNTISPFGYYNNGYLDLYINQPTTLWGTTFFSGWRNGFGKFPVYEGKKETLSLGEFRAGFELPLLKDGEIDKNRTSLAKAEVDLQIAKLKILEKRNKTLKSVGEKYWKWVATGNKYLIAKNVLNIAEKRIKDLEISFKSGLISKMDLLENQRSIFQRQQKLIIEERDFRSAATELSFYFRGEDGTPLNPEDYNYPLIYDLENLSEKYHPEADLTRVLKNNPEYLVLEEKINKINLEVLLYRNQLSPSLDLQFAISQDIGSGSQTRQPFELDAGIYFSYPFQLREYSGRLKEAENDLKKLNLEKQLFSDNLLNELKVAYYQITSGWQNYQNACQEYELANKLQIMENERVLLGNSDLLILNLREQNTADAASRKVTSFTDFLQAVLSYESLVYNL